MIIDYNDLIKSGHISPDNKPTPSGRDQIYACYIVKDGATHPKFNITSKDDVVKSIEAINVNVDLPEEISKVAKYFIKQAAVVHDIDLDWDVSPPKDIVNRAIHLESDEVNETVYGFTLKSASFQMEDVNQIKYAEEFFLTNLDFCSGSDRHLISQQIVKAAATKDYIPAKEVVAYSNLSFAQPDVVNDLLEKRASYCSDDEVKDCYNHLKGVWDSLDPRDFLNMISSLDKTAGINNFFMPAHKFFMMKERISPEDIKPQKSVADKYEA